MSSDPFAVFTARVTAQLTRRRTLGLLSLLGATGLGLAEDAEAKRKRKRKHKNKKKPKTCSDLAEGASCGKGGPGVCTHGVCGRPCEWADDQCPGESFCPLESTVCVTDYFCERPCDEDAECLKGEICIATQLCAQVGAKRCAPVAPL